MTVPFAPYRPAARVVAQAAPPNGVHAQQPVIEYTDEIVEVGEEGAGGGRGNALADMMQQQARVAHEAAVDDDVQAAVLAVLERRDEPSIEEEFQP
jgi:hypothetical protein